MVPIAGQYFETYEVEGYVQQQNKEIAVRRHWAQKKLYKKLLQDSDTYGLEPDKTFLYVENKPGDHEGLLMRATSR